MIENLPQRKSPRLPDYDYSLNGAYFVTICTHQRLHLFGDVHDGEMHSNAVGDIAQERWSALPEHHQHITLDLFVVMPNHVHGILFLDGESVSLSTVIGAFKSGVSRRVRQLPRQSALQVWQGRYHDHIIRNEQSLQAIREYVLYNPARWQQDKFYDEG
jgi:REP element-mobilizing transposase RayT